MEQKKKRFIQKKKEKNIHKETYIKNPSEIKYITHFKFPIHVCY